MKILIKSFTKRNFLRDLTQGTTIALGNKAIIVPRVPFPPLHLRFILSYPTWTGETVRYFTTRVNDHLASDKASRIFKHLQNSEHCRALCSADCFHMFWITSPLVLNLSH